MLVKRVGIVFLLLVSMQAQARPVPKMITPSQVAALKVFFQNDVVIEAKTLDKSPYVLALAGEHMMNGAPTDRVYVRGLDLSGYKQDYALFRRGEAYRDPDTKKILGYEGTYIGEGKVTDIGDPAELLLEKVTREVKPGDRLISSELARLDTNIRPHRARNYIKGQIVAVKGGVVGLGTYHIVVLNRGERQGVRIGDVLGIYKRGTPMRDPYAKGEKITTPRDFEGELIVFKCFDSMSIGLVVAAILPMSVADEVSNI